MVVTSALVSLWLGILTGIGPCPMAINIAAISYIGRRVGNWRHVLAAGLLYTLGRMSVYVAVGVLLATAIVSSADISLPLQRFMMQVIGPILLIVALFLFGAIRINTGGVCGMGERMQKRADSWSDTQNLLGAGLLGVLFALTFCPVSAALFFGTVIGLSMNSHSNVIVPAMFGVGTALPVVVFAVAIACSAKSVGAIFKRLAGVEKWFRLGAGVIFALVGCYMIWKYTF